MGLTSNPVQPEQFYFHLVYILEVTFGNACYNRLLWIGRTDRVFIIQDYYSKVQAF